MAKPKPEKPEKPEGVSPAWVLLLLLLMSGKSR